MAELNPLSQRLAKYVDNDSIPDAIGKLRQMTFNELQGRYPGGVPDAVMFRLMMAGMQSQIDFVRDLSVDALSHIHDWNEEETVQQQNYAVLMLEFMREEGKWVVLEMMGKMEEGGEGE